jgi:hypothetical protein
MAKTITYEEYQRWLKEEPRVVWRCECGGPVEIDGHGSPAVGSKLHCRASVLRPDDIILHADDIKPRRLAWGRRAVAHYLSQSDRWLARQLERGKIPPPVFKVGTAIVGDLDELDLWLAQWKARSWRTTCATQ